MKMKKRRNTSNDVIYQPQEHQASSWKRRKYPGEGGGLKEGNFTQTEAHAVENEEIDRAQLAIREEGDFLEGEEDREKPGETGRDRERQEEGRERVRHVMNRKNRLKVRY